MFLLPNWPLHTYINDLLDKIVAAAVGKNLPLRRLVVKQNVECGVLVGVCPLVEGTEINKLPTRANSVTNCDRYKWSKLVFV